MRNALLPILVYRLPRRPGAQSARPKRNALIARLALMLMEATVIVTEERGDDEE